MFSWFPIKGILTLIFFEDQTFEQEFWKMWVLTFCNNLQWSRYSVDAISYVLFKFIYSEKAKAFCEIFSLLLSYVAPVKSKVKISQNFVAFSEYMNFNYLSNYLSIKWEFLSSKNYK